MKKPAHVRGPWKTIRWILRQAWSDLKSVYYANTPVWRWLKSGALVFLGLCTWAGAAVVLSVRPEWTFLTFVMAYGFLLVFWGPLTHFGIVPLVLKVRRTASHPLIRAIGRHGGKINLSIFFILVILLAIVQPGVMLLEFSPGIGEPGTDVSGSIECSGPEDGLITCDISNPSGFDHAVIMTGGTVVDRADEEPYRMSIHEEEVVNNQFRVVLRAEDESPLRTRVYTP